MYLISHQTAKLMHSQQRLGMEKKKCVGLHPNAGLTLCDVSAHQSVQISHVRLPRYGLMSLDPQCGKPRVLTGVDTICVDVLKGKNTKINIVEKD